MQKIERRLPVEIFESLSLLHSRVKRQRVELQKSEKGFKTTNAIDGVRKDERSSGMIQQEIIEIDILRRK